MKKQLILISLVCSSFLMAETFVNPLPVANRATDTGGTLPAIDAYSDGVGAVVLDNLRSVDNSAMNSLVYTYGVEAKTNSLTIADQVLLTGTQADIAKASVFFVNGSSCDDKNIGTAGETWLNGVCQGGIILHADGENCADLDLNTNDFYLNGVCTHLTNSCVNGYNGAQTRDISCSSQYSNPLNWSNLTRVTGNLSFQYSQNPDLTFLKNLTAVNGNLDLTYANASSLNGLEKLTFIQKDLLLRYIGNNTDISVISNLTVGRYVYVDGLNLSKKLPATSPICQKATNLFLNGNRSSICPY